MRNDRSFAAVDAYIEEQMKRLNIPGAALAVVQGDQIVHQRGFGKAHPGGAPPTPQTPFFIGSLTKSFTALAVMQLAEAGKIELDAPVQGYLPWFTLADAQAASQVTVRHLLNQTSGLSTWAGWIPLDVLEDGPGADQRRAQALSTIKLNHPAGAAFEYSNLNYVLLGMIIQMVSGAAYADYIQSHIFHPLGMRHTYTTEAEAKRDGLADGYRYWFWQPFPAENLQEPRSSLPGGGILSSVEDMARYLIAQMNEGRCGDTQILSPAGVAEMHRRAAPIEIMGWAAHYAMGWYNEKFGQTEIIWHGGTMPNFASVAAFLPEQQKGVILLLNIDHFLMNPVITEMGHSLAARLAGEQSPPGPLGLHFASFAPWAMRALLLIPLLQILDVVSTLRQMARWRQDPRHRPSRRRLWWQHLLLPLMPNLGFAAVPVYLQVKKRLRFLLDYFPDFSWIAITGGAFAGIWAILRAVLILRVVRKQ
jgi:CubicO group peptidase (beta-lactamase class C family)